jgi:hypothetical protein
MITMMIMIMTMMARANDQFPSPSPSGRSPSFPKSLPLPLSHHVQVVSCFPRLFSPHTHTSPMVSF